MIASLDDPAEYDGTNASLTGAITPDGRPEIGVKYRIPPRCGVAVKLPAGQQLQIENTYGTQVCDFWAYLAAVMSACPQDKNPINGADVKPSEIHSIIKA
ncbi:urea carboxylase-associated family protein [Candidatus Puniceispirillum sp.]|nr:urea carboxylase-associated family protein [Candidatus Puniceispirillum sp.]